MWNLDDTTHFIPVLSLTVPWARTYADIRPGHTDREHREELRKTAIPHLIPAPVNTLWWAVRIAVTKAGNRPFDIENVPKPIIDAFCAWQIARDRSTCLEAGLFRHDTLDHVRILQVSGQRGHTSTTRIDIFAFLGPLDP
jgi:hypothetical protein